MIPIRSALDPDPTVARKPTAIPLLVIPHDDPQMNALAQRVRSVEQELAQANEDLDSLRTQRAMLAITTVGGPLLVWLVMRNRKTPPVAQVVR